MSDVAEYRFLPWTRRGLAAEIEGPDQGGPLPERGALQVGLTVSGVGAASMDLSIYGPGDVLGLDHRLVIRTDPRPGSTDVEANYLPGIEFDLPDLPWMFTPAAVAAGDRLRPWLVLVCLDRALVAPPHMTRADGTRGPLPVVELTADAVATELPDLRESWAWAHAQVARDDAAGPVAGDDLAADPILNLSRLLCPRHLMPGHSYVACLVPAFDAGVRRGLTGQPPFPPAPGPPPTIGPAWDVGSPTPLVLPVYHHWEFATGPAGDFEELAKRLDPFECPPTVGHAPMHVGHAHPTLPVIADGAAGARLDMDGALRAPVGVPGRLAEVHGPLRTGLRQHLNAADDNAAGSGSAQTPVMGPPLYGSWHARRHRLAASSTGWFAETNLDPRARVANGLAAEVVRRNQEELVHAAWEQVGRILDANSLLNWGRLALETARRLHERHLKTLPASRLIQLAAPMRARVKVDDLTIGSRIGGTSLPDAAADPAMRRLTGGRHRLVRKAGIRSGVGLTHGAAAGTVRMFETLAAGRAEVDPNRFDLDGLAGSGFLDGLVISPSGTAPVDLGDLGITVAFPADVLRDGRARYRTVASALSGVGEKTVASSVSVRDDLQATGVVTRVHLDAIAVTPVAGGGTVLDSGSGGRVLDALLTSVRANPRATGFLVDASRARPRVDALDVDATGTVVVRTPLTSRSVAVARLGTELAAAGSTSLTSALSRVPAGSLTTSVRAGDLPNIDLAADGRPVLDRVGPGAASNTLPPPVRDAAVINRFESAWRGAFERLSSAPAVPTRRIVTFDLSRAASAVLVSTDPAVTVPKRLATMLTVGGRSVLSGVDDRLVVSGLADRVLAFPDLPVPAYELLARFDRERFLPGLEAIPPNAVTLLETNPRFVEAFLLGMNHEMNGELLWREYPTDRRGTPLRRFWDWHDDGPDIEPIHTWRETSELGTNTRGGVGGQIVLLVRGDLLRRYPNTSVLAWRADGRDLKNPPGDGDIVNHVFAGRFDPDVSFYGFPLTDDDLEDDGWFFVLQEQPTEPRFGFDEAALGGATPPLTTWSDASWAHAGTAPGGHLRLEGHPLSGTTRNGATFAAHSGHLAAITLQRPVRVAVRSGRLVDL